MGWTQPYRVLSLDGGGMRGVYTASYLGAAGRAFALRRGGDQLDIGKAFDLIVGASTGAIVGAALAAGIGLDRVAHLYRAHGRAIFRRRVPSQWWDLPGDLAERREALEQGERALKAALTEAFGNMTLGHLFAERGIAMAVPAVEMSQHRSWVFKTPHLADETNNRDNNTTLVDVCLASSAAPIFRSLARVPRTDGTVNSVNYFADGGLWGNNPVLIALTEALRASEPGRPIEILCMGSCPRPAGEQVADAKRHRNLMDWRFGADAATLSIDAQEFAFDNIARMLKGRLDRPCEIVRFPADKVPAALVRYLGLDDARDEAMDALIAQALADADMLNALCADATSVIAKLVCGAFDAAPVFSNPAREAEMHTS